MILKLSTLFNLIDDSLENSKNITIICDKEDLKIIQTYLDSYEINGTYYKNLKGEPMLFEENMIEIDAENYEYLIENARNYKGKIKNISTDSLYAIGKYTLSDFYNVNTSVLFVSNILEYDEIGKEMYKDCFDKIDKIEEQMDEEEYLEDESCEDCDCDCDCDCDDCNCDDCESEYIKLYDWEELIKKEEKKEISIEYFLGLSLIENTANEIIKSNGCVSCIRDILSEFANDCEKLGVKKFETGEIIKVKK